MISLKTTKELVEELNLLDESDSIEAKQISGLDVGSSVYETISAFSNEPSLGGGTILLGVKKEELLFPFYTATGIKDPDKLSNDITSACQNKFNAPVRLKIGRDLVDGQIVLRLDISEIPSAQKPLYIVKEGLPKGAFRRIGGADIRCTQEDLAAFFQDRTANTFDAHIVPDSDPDDIDPNAIGAYRRSIAESNPSSEILSWSDQEILFGVTALKKLDEKPRATATGILMFGRTQSLRRLFPTIRVDYVRVQGKHWVKDPENRFNSLDLRGPIITLISRIIGAVSDDLPKTFKLEDASGGQRLDLPIIPLAAIREAIVNAMMHRNYALSRPVQILRFSNRLVIENPGYSLKATEQYDDPGSITRNPHIAAILHETRFAETKGSGMRVMRQLLRQAGLSAPTFESDRENDIFRVTFLFHHFLGKGDWEWLGRFSDYGLTNELLRALVFVRETEQISNSVFRDFTGLDTLAASSGLRRLRQLGLLEKKGSGSQTFYVAGPKLLPLMDLAGDTLEPRFQGNEIGLQGRVTAGVETGLRSISIFDQLPQKLKERVINVALAKRVQPIVVRSIILDICKLFPVSAHELSSMLSRDQAYVSQEYLTPMVKEKILNQTITETPNHPDQKYSAS